MSCFDLDASTLRSALSKALHLSESWTTLPSIKIRELVRSVIERVRVHDEKVNVSLKPKELASVLLGNNCRLPRMDNPISSSCASKPSCAGRVKE